MSNEQSNNHRVTIFRVMPSFRIVEVSGVIASYGRWGGRYLEQDGGAILFINDSFHETRQAAIDYMRAKEHAARESSRKSLARADKIMAAIQKAIHPEIES